MNKTVDVRARISAEEKQRASETLEDMGLTVSQAIRLFLSEVADRKALPFRVKVPNQTTLEAMHELERGEGQEYQSVDAMFEALKKD